MILQISSGVGSPVECNVAVTKLYNSLCKEFPDIELVTSHNVKNTNLYSSIIFESNDDLSELDGTIQWICKSPLRPHHERKNWFIDVSVIPETEDICDELEVKFESFKSSGKGGQHVNKTESGVRVIHIPTGVVVTSTKERSQFLNKKDALRKLSIILSNRKAYEKDKQRNTAWRENNKLVRGNPIRVYEGLNFVRRK